MDVDPDRRRARAAPPAPEPRLLDRPAAAAYCSLSPEAFSQWVKTGKLPEPLEGTKRWDRKAIDLALDRLSGIETKDGPESPLDEWRRKRGKT